jgi:S-methylmethionine-dependent homocysteine/selenocysteine methylase
MDHPAWSAAANLTHPDLIQTIHEDYIRASADLIIANTFGTSRHILELSGLTDQFEAINAAAVKLARQARETTADRAVWIAGSISTTTFGREQPPMEIAKVNFADQANILAEAGADLIILEMMRDTVYTRLALDAARQTGLPVWVGYSCITTTDGDLKLRNPQYGLDESLRDLSSDEVELVAIMHTLTEDTAPALRALQQHWTGPVGAYAHSGEFIMPRWRFTDVMSPEGYAQEALQWVEMGAQVIGGCCGIGPEHISLLSERLPSRQP